MDEQENGDDGVTLVSGSQGALVENLTDEEKQALREFDDAIEKQCDPSSLDQSTLDTLSKIWIVRKSRGRVTPVIKVIWGGPVLKRNDYI